MALRIMRLFFTVAIGAGLYWLYDTYFVRVLDLAKSLTTPVAPNISVEKVMIQSFNEKGMIRFKLFGKVATVLEKEKTTKITPVNLLIYDAEKNYQQEIAIFATEGVHFNTEPDYFQLTGNVECNLAVAEESDKNFEKVQYIRKVFTHKLLYYPDLNKFVSPGKFKIVDTRDNSIVRGDSLVYYTEKGTGEIQGNFRAVFHEDPLLVLDEINVEFSHEN